MERNSLRQVEWDTNRRVVGAAEGRINGETPAPVLPTTARTTRVSACSRALQLSRDVQYASSWRAYQELRYLTSGVDDLISRGNGPVQFDDRLQRATSTSSRRASATGS